MMEPQIHDGSLATKILGEAKKAARSHNFERLEREKSRLIKEINYSFGKNFYNQRIENYTDYATIQTLLNDWRKWNDADFNRVTMYENKAHSILMRPKEKVNLMQEHDKNIDNLVVQVMTKKYNEQYGKQLTDVQQMLVKQYVFAENGDSTAFQKALNRIKETTIRDLVDFQSECNNDHVANKINEVKKDIRDLSIDNLDDQTMSRFLTLCDLSEELRRNDK